MNRSQDGHMRLHFKQNNLSSTSLEGMERPVPSFKSFIQTTPRHRTETDKALPPTPSPWKAIHTEREETPSPPSVGRSSGSIDRTASTVSWKAPAAWCNDSASATPPQPLTPPLSAPRTFSPLIPDPSYPGMPGMMASEPTTWLGPSSAPAGRLLPIYERTNGTSDLGPPGSPPNSPLPATPSFNHRSIEDILPPEHRRTNSSPGPGSNKVAGTNLRVRTLSPASSESSDASTKEKASAMLGIGLSQPGQKRADKQYLRGKKLRALYKGSPLADDSWEDQDMDDKTRELCFSQDYHDLLADQYQAMNVRAEEVLSSGGAHQVNQAQFEESNPKGLPGDHELVPRPLPWQKSSGHTTPRSQSQDRETEQSSTSEKKTKQKRLSSWVPHRLSVAPSPAASIASNQDEHPKKAHPHSKSKQIPESEVANALSDDLRFSMFFPTSRPIKFGKKHKKSATAKAPPAASSPPQSTLLVRLPGGVALIRTHSPSPLPKSDVLSETSPKSDHTRGSSQFGSDYSHTNSDHRSSYNSHHSQLPAHLPTRTTYRISAGSSYSHRSTSSHPLAQEISNYTHSPPPPPPPPPPPLPSSSSSPISLPLSPDTWTRLQSTNTTAEQRYKPTFIEKAKEARRRRHDEARQDRLKRSIKVLGPTDPGVVAGYVRPDERVDEVGGRRPGYMGCGGS